ncbi:mandelate racemase/muconate lactonizing enzyme family protein [Petrotoga sp. 9PWA.NaAc.5.4]|uniref:mandelate racemase/muconate lactonizing enzyme family protein n=1 Tax=Petrotoga sp. 9PWA.NaAc.5.4 TaxID=1434328 RepID=UPI000CC62ED1|nr:dipeptide epimerase [Petrotoga sp. 9PWA.NaAc.5.4]PNR97011.1 chloromuconate cycloisomerase [Petrotoga sp. 9PWA.NaAc.5.4]
MKIIDLNFKRVRIKLLKPFVISRGISQYCDSVILKIKTDVGYYGYGEATPSKSVTGETIESVLITLEFFKELVMGEDPLAIERVHDIMDKAIIGNTAAKAAIDIALYDIKGKVMSVPLYKVLGGFDNKVQTDITIGIGTPKEMAQEAKERVEQGFKILKIKTGRDSKEDIEAVKLIRETVGNDIKLKIDANQGWSVSDTIKVAKAVEKYDIEVIEQPLAYWDLEGLAFLRNKINIKIMPDETVHNSHDALKIIKEKAADMINIKLMKSGGLYEAEKINAVAESGGINCMLGCMVETKIALTAAASLVAAKKNIVAADLDSFLYYEEPDFIKGGFEKEADIIKLLDKPGLGIEVDL